MLKKHLSLATSISLFMLYVFSNFSYASAQNGIIDNVKLSSNTPIISYSNIQVKDTATTVDKSSDISKISALDTITISSRIRIPKEQLTSDNIMALFGVSNSKHPNTYASIYIIPSTGRIGIEVRDQEKNINHHVYGSSNELKNSYWHTVTFKADAITKEYSLYLDGNKIVSSIKNDYILFKNINNLNSIKIGDVDRSSGNRYTSKIDIDSIDVYNYALNDSNIEAISQATYYEFPPIKLPDGVVKSDPSNLFYPNYDNSNSYRIPSVITTKKGNVIAAIDKRNTHSSDWGNIDTAIRISNDNGVTFSEPKVVLDLPTNTSGATGSAFAIDVSMLQDEFNERIFLLVDVFPEGQGFFDAQVGSGYKQINGKKYLRLYANSSEIEYTVRENGIVYNDNENIPTDYYVSENGDLYEKIGDTNLKRGNIMLKRQDNNKDCPLIMLKTSYLYLMYSDDEGNSWSKPVDLNSQVKEDWMKFLGTGPGNGIQLTQGPNKGRLVFPVYHVNNVSGNSQSSAVIYSDDGGVTWHRGESANDGRIFNGQILDSKTMNNSAAELTESQVIEMPNGELKLFCRNRSGYVAVATSKNGGESWENTVVNDKNLRDPYCQMSIYKYPKPIDGVEYVIFSNPSASNRSNGSVQLGKIEPNTNDISWIASKVIEPGDYAYSSLTVMNNGNIGLFYENGSNMKFTYFNLDWLLYDIDSITPELKAPAKVISVETDASDNMQLNLPGKDINFTVIYDQPVFVMGEPNLEIFINNNEKSFRSASYIGGSGSDKLKFSYTITNDDKGKLSTRGNLVYGSSSVTNIHQLEVVISEVEFLYDYYVGDSNLVIDCNNSGVVFSGLQDNTYKEGTPISVAVLPDNILSDYNFDKYFLEIKDHDNSSYYTLVDISPDSLSGYNIDTSNFNPTDKYKLSLIGHKYNLYPVQLSQQDISNIVEEANDTPITNPSTRDSYTFISISLILLTLSVFQIYRYLKYKN